MRGPLQATSRQPLTALSNVSRGGRAHQEGQLWWIKPSDNGRHTGGGARGRFGHPAREPKRLIVAKFWQLAPMLWTGYRNYRFQWATPKGWRSRFGWGECRVGRGSCPQWLRPLNTPQARIWRGWLAIRPGVRPPSSGSNLRWLDDMNQPSTHHPGKPPPARVEVPEGLHGQQLGGPAIMLRRTTKGTKGQAGQLVTPQFQNSNSSREWRP